MHPPLLHERLNRSRWQQVSRGDAQSRHVLSLDRVKSISENVYNACASLLNACIILFLIIWSQFLNLGVVVVQDKEVLSCNSGILLEESHNSSMPKYFSNWFESRFEPKKESALVGHRWENVR